MGFDRGWLVRQIGEKEEKEARNPNYGVYKSNFNCQKIGDAQNEFTIKKFDIAIVVNILKGIADSFNMLRLAVLLA